MGKAGKTFHRLWLLFWKNLILRKRQYIVSGMEIVLPTLFAILMAYLRAKISIDGEVEPSSNSIFPEYSEEDIIGFAREQLTMGWAGPAFNYTINMAYAPNNPTTKDFTKRLTEQLTNITDRLVWRGFNNDKEIEAFAAQYDLAQGSDMYGSGRFVGAIVFNGLDSDISSANRKISYKIRLVDRFDNTKEIMPWVTFGGPNTMNENNYNYMGFSGFQILIDKMLMFMLTNVAPAYNLSVQAFPYPPYDAFDFDQVYFILLPQFMVLGFIFIIPSCVRGIVSEKETGIKELMKMTGLPNWMHWVGWMLNSMVVLIISVTIVIILFFVTFNSKTGAVLKDSDPSLWWFVLLIYAIWATTYCFLISSIFERPTLATTLGIVLWLVTYYGVALPLEPQYSEQSLSTKMLLCLVPNMGLHYALKVMSSFEARGVGAQWSKIADPVSTVDSLTLGYVLLMLVIDIILYTLLAMYFEKIIPTKYGVRKPWYFIFMPSEWGFGKRKEVSDDISMLKRHATDAEEGESFEKVPKEYKAGVEILKLRKEFGTSKTAVNDVSVKVYEGQIFCLLGHNGAGKTTTMSILTGLIGPTSGTALVNGYDIRTEMDEIRQDLGLCPQHNLLFAKLTVAEHLKFFGMVKGLSSSEANLQVPDLIRKLQLQEKANVLSMSLSGGQKRRLSLGCAVIGGSKVLFLDECSSGLDPEARRGIWDLLLEIRGQRTIILTTHFLEEADVLGDRIAIMAGGKVQCCGSPMFLKKFYGAGYTLSLTLTSDGSAHNVLETIRKHIPSAFVKSQVEGELIELAITLPSENINSANFPEMFSEILAQKTQLKIQDVGIALTTMDEVFIKVDEISHSNGSTGSTNIGLESGPNGRAPKCSGIQLIMQQFWGLLLKKILYSMRRWKLTLSQMIFPVLLLIAAILIGNVSYSDDDNTPALAMSLSSYKKQIVLYSPATDGPQDVNLSSAYKKAVVYGSTAEALRLQTGSNLTMELLSVGQKDIDSYRQRYVVAAAFDSTKANIKAMYSTLPAHACPLSINLATNAILETLAPGAGHSIEVINHPLASGMRQIFDAASPNPSFSEVIPYAFGVLVSIGLSLLAASFIVMPIEERICQAKQLQLMTGVNPVLYWGSSFIWDYFVMLICVCVMVACFPIFERYEAYTNNGGAGVAFLIFAVYGLIAISFSYLFSLFAQTPAGGFALVTILHIISIGTAMALGVYILEDDNKLAQTAKIIQWIGRFFPTYSVAKSAMIFARLSTQNSRCNVLTDDIRTVLCDPNLSDSYYNLKEMQSCCYNCKELGAECFEPQPYLVWQTKTPDYEYYEQYDPPGVGQEVFWMCIMFIVYMTLLVLVEFGIVKKLLNKVLKQKDVTFTNNSDDNDVQNEAERVKNLIQTGRTSEDAMVVDNLCKSFGTFSAVSKLTFGVHHGECFGLLGVNGAGKTTSFRMLTGDEIISNGNAFLNMMSLQSDRKSFLSSIGYCPQFDGIIGVLTGKEMLELFARIRGVYNSSVGSEAAKWLDRMGLSDSATVRCHKYSGGMKRRLSAAMAMIGDPPVVLLDEPTSGVDAVSRRQFWNIISSLRDLGQAIILTSHSMEECEFLCSRLGIMVNGEMQCLGGVQHLKNKFAQGYTLTVRLKQEALFQPQSIAALINEITRQFYPCSVKDQHQNTMQFHIESTTMQWDTLFKTMEGVKSQFDDFIDEYSVQQTTLEEVFLSFARKQYSNERQVKTSFFRKILSLLFGC